MKYTVIIPTMWLHPVLLETMVVKYNRHPLIDEILLVDNDGKRRMDLSYAKVRVIGNGVNMFVNPAWNLGVKEAQTEGVIIANDDILIKELDEAMRVIDAALRPGVAIFPHKTCFAKYGGPKGEPRTAPGDRPDYGFGTFMAMCRNTYRIIPEGLKVWWGDHLQWDYTQPLFLMGVEIVTEMRGTSRTLNLAGVSSREREYYFKWKESYEPETYSADTIRHKGTVMTVLKGGGDFSFRDVLLITDRVRAHNGIGVQVKCILDRADRVWELGRVQLQPMMNNRWKGWWSKMNLFAPELEAHRPFLYLDLDTAVVGPLNGVLPPEGYVDQFVTLEDFYHKGRLATGMMWVPKGSAKVKQIWDRWIEAPEKHMTKYRGDQEFIRDVVEADVFWQDVTGAVSSYKPRTGHLTTVPPGVRVVCFHGKPRIWEAARKVEWVRDYVNG